MKKLSVCPDCKAEFQPCEGVTHAYLGANSECWGLYGEILAKEYQSPEYMTVHRLTVDAYAAQHPGKPEKRTIQSINVHLLALYLMLERGLRADFVTKSFDSLISKYGTELEWLTPPSSLGDVTVKNIALASSPEEHTDIVTKWARSVWESWSEHHSRIKSLANLVIDQNRTYLDKSISEKIK